LDGYAEKSIESSLSRIQSAAVVGALQKMAPSELWRFLPIGYLFSILIETPILLVGLSQRHPLKRRLFAGIWLTACTYPIVVLVLPLVLANVSRAKYLVVAEVFAPVAECVLFWLAYGEAEEVGKLSMWRDFGAIVVANLASFVGGEVLAAYDWFGLLG
jgi:hypothetical protein